VLLGIVRGREKSAVHLQFLLEAETETAGKETWGDSAWEVEAAEQDALVGQQEVLR